MTRIRVLDENTANRISAGEVVERPYSVVKELVENALDSGATAVTVDITGGGIEKIRVTDNGSGIDASDLRMAFERHATSKIASGDALNRIGTLGFRGEALPSIASVAKVQLTSRPSKDEIGARIRIEGGKVLSMQEAGCPQGTTVQVEDLFFNTPARRKFLKRPQTEGALIGDMMAQLALSRPELSLRFVLEGKSVFQTTGDGKLQNAITTVLGVQTAKNMFRVEGQSGYVKLSGYVGTGEASRGNRSYEMIFVNGRTVRPAPVYQGLETALKERVMIGRFPVCALHVQVPLDSVDVNCHPSKMEVRFADEVYVRQAVYEIVVQALIDKDAQARKEQGVPEVPPAQAPMPLHTPEPAEQLHFSVPGAAKGPLKLREASPIFDIPPIPSPTQAQATSVNPPEPVASATPPQPAPAPQPFTLPDYEVLGQVYGTYVLVKTAAALLVIDQHAAHERVVYDRLMKALDTGSVSQPLLVGLIYDVSLRDKQRIFEHIDLLHELGFEVEDFGPTSVRVTAVPVILGEPDAGGFLADFVDNLDDLAQMRQIEKKRERIITMACRKAIKAGDPLSRASMEALLTQIFQNGTIPHCPHGRPILLEISEKELERRFKRIV